MTRGRSRQRQCSIRPIRHRSRCGALSSAGTSYHVGLDTMMGRRSRHRPEEVTIDGFLLLDTGEYELVTAFIHSTSSGR